MTRALLTLAAFGFASAITILMNWMTTYLMDKIDKMNNYKQFLKQHGWPAGGPWTDAQLEALLGALGSGPGTNFLTLAARDAIQALRRDDRGLR